MKIREKVFKSKTSQEHRLYAMGVRRLHVEERKISEKIASEIEPVFSLYLTDYELEGLLILAINEHIRRVSVALAMRIIFDLEKIGRIPSLKPSALLAMKNDTYSAVVLKKGNRVNVRFILSKTNPYKEMLLCR